MVCRLPVFWSSVVMGLSTVRTRQPSIRLSTGWTVCLQREFVVICCYLIEKWFTLDYWILSRLLQLFAAWTCNSLHAYVLPVLWYIIVLWRLPSRNRKPRFFVRNVKNRNRGFLEPSEDGFSVRRLYLYSVKLYEQTGGQTYKYARQQRPPRSPPSRRVDVWRRCNLWTVWRKTDGWTGIELGVF